MPTTASSFSKTSVVAGEVTPDELVLRQLLPQADEGLRRWGVATAVRERYLGVIEGRAKNGRTGASWQVQTVAALQPLVDESKKYIVQQRAGVGSAVLLRAVEPLVGLPLMRKRRHVRARGPAADRVLTNGPGQVCAALGIDGRANGASLQRGPVFVLRGDDVTDADVAVSPRIGITRASHWPQRYFVRDNPFVSRTPSTFAVRRYTAG